MRFTEIPERLNYPRRIKGKLSTLHSEVVDYVVKCYSGTFNFKKLACTAINIVSYYVKSNDDFPDNWSLSNPFANIPYVDEEILQESLGDLFLAVGNVEWDLEISDTPYIESKLAESTPETKPDMPDAPVESNAPIEVGTDAEPLDQPAAKADTPSTDLDDTTPTVESRNFTFESITGAQPSNKVTQVLDENLTLLEDISLTGPVIPCLDTTRTWIEKEIYGKKYCIYYSLPEIPTRQCEISVTTDVNKMTDADFLRLFPNRRFYTRPDVMYSEDAKGLSHLTYVPEIGYLPKISGFTEDQVLDNVFKYPYVGELFREGRRKTYPRDIIHLDFWKRIEINGELYNTSAIWSDLEDTRDIPKYPGYMAEYVVRRFLLERDYKIVNHQYQMFGTLEPFLVLFMPVDEYIAAGFKDVIDVGKQCVNSRVSYRRSRNPVIRRIEAEDE